MTETMTLPRLSNYGRYSSDNYGAHTMQVDIGPLTLYYSYSTLVAFRSPETGLVVHANDWGPTTGKHLNWIDGLSGRNNNRLPSDQFEAKWQSVHDKYFA